MPSEVYQDEKESFEAQRRAYQKRKTSRPRMENNPTFQGATKFTAIRIIKT